MPGAIVDELLGRGEPAPGFPVRVVFDDVAVFHPLLSAVPDLLPARRRGERGDRLGGGDVDLRVREIRCAADVVGVEVGEHDVADVLAAEAESVELVCRRLGRIRTQGG